MQKNYLIMFGVSLLASMIISNFEIRAEGNNNVIWLMEPQKEFSFYRYKDYFPFYFKEEMVAVKKNNKFGFMNKEGKVVIECKFANVCDFHEGLAAVQMEPFGEWGFINKKGELVISPQYHSDYLYSIISYFSEGLAAVQIGKNGKWGYINKEGVFVIEQKFYKAKKFSEGLAAVQLEKKGKWGYINKKGRIIIEMKFGFADDFSEGFAQINDTTIRKRGYINKKGKLVIILGNHLLGGSWSAGLIPFYDEKIKKYGYKNTKDQYGIAPAFVRANDFSEGLAAVKPEKNDKWGYINKKGKVVIAPQFHPGDGADNFSEGLACVKVNDKWGYINHQGEFVIKAQFDEAYSFSEGVAMVKINNRCGFIKNPVPVEKMQDSFDINELYIGNIKSVNKGEIIVGGRRIAETVCLWDRLCLFVNSEVIILRATFPMQTVTKCKIISGNINHIKPGMKVYKYRKDKKQQQ